MPNKKTKSLHILMCCWSILILHVHFWVAWFMHINLKSIYFISLQKWQKAQAIFVKFSVNVSEVSSNHDTIWPVIMMQCSFFSEWCLYFRCWQLCHALLGKTKQHSTTLCLVPQQRTVSPWRYGRKTFSVVIRLLSSHKDSNWGSVRWVSKYGCLRPSWITWNSR